MTQVSLALKDPDRRAAILNSDLEKNNSWEKRWKVSFNKEKNEFLTFKKPSSLPTVIWKYSSRRQGMSQTLRSDFSK